ncbi:MAG: type II toxin-antitoxin system HicB family antitoxin [Candidatus Lokiarchaeia archaeon]
MNKYTVEIFYSEEDAGYIVLVPELQGCSAFGKSKKEALEEVKIAIGLWLETAEKEGREIPKPQGKNSSKNSKKKQRFTPHS